MSKFSKCFVYDNCVYTQDKDKPEDCACYTIYSSGTVANTGFAITWIEFNEKKRLEEMIK